VQRDLLAPLTGESCVGFHVDVISSRSDDWGPIELYNRSRNVTLEIDDGTGRLAIRADQLTLGLDGTVTWKDCAEPAAIDALFDSPLAGVPMAILEGVVRAGDQLVVCGTVSFDRSQGVYRDGTPTPTLVASQDGPVIGIVADPPPSS
jgi:hypothetical protein